MMRGEKGLQRGAEDDSAPGNTCDAYGSAADVQDTVSTDRRKRIEWWAECDAHRKEMSDRPIWFPDAQQEPLVWAESKSLNPWNVPEKGARTRSKRRSSLQDQRDLSTGQG